MIDFIYFLNEVPKQCSLEALCMLAQLSNKMKSGQKEA